MEEQLMSQLQKLLLASREVEPGLSSDLRLHDAMLRTSVSRCTLENTNDSTDEPSSTSVSDDLGSTSGEGKTQVQRRFCGLLPVSPTHFRVTFAWKNDTACPWRPTPHRRTHAAYAAYRSIPGQHVKNPSKPGRRYLPFHEDFSWKS